ncbi:hypothetical protein Tco_0004913 [Tanacetum coccineum]
MSDSEHSTVTYTSIFSDDGSLDIGSPGVIVYGYNGLAMMPADPYAYVEAAMQEPPPPYFIPELVYAEFMPPEDDVFPTKEQPLPAAVSPTADSPDYITESDLKEDLEEEDDEDPEEDPADYPIDKDNEEEESSRDDANDEEEEDEDKEEEEEEHLVPADSVPPPPLVYHVMARMSIRAQIPTPFPSEEEVDRLLALPTPPSSPLTSYSSPLPQIPSPPLPISPSPLPARPTHSLGYKAPMIQMRAESPSTSHPLPLPPPIILPRTRASMAMMRAAAPSTYCLAPPSGTPPSGVDVFEVLLPPQKRFCIAPDLRFEVRESSSVPTAMSNREIGNGITDVWEDPDEIAKEIPSTDVAELGQRLMESEARLSHEAWAQSMDASDMASSEVRALWTTVLAQQTEIKICEQQTTDNRHSSKCIQGNHPEPELPPPLTPPPPLMTDAAIRALITRGVPDALAEQEIQRNNNLNDDGSQGMEGVAGLTQWFERMEFVFHISNCAVENQVKFATCTLYEVALTWWNTHVKTECS